MLDSEFCNNNGIFYNNNNNIKDSNILYKDVDYTNNVTKINYAIEIRS